MSGMPLGWSGMVWDVESKSNSSNSNSNSNNASTLRFRIIGSFRGLVAPLGI